MRLRLTRGKDSEEKPRQWTVSTEGGGLVVTLPDGASLKLQREDDTLLTLSSLATTVPGINEIARGEHVEIHCSQAVRDALPLWLRPTDDEVSSGEEKNDFPEGVDEFMFWSNYSPDHSLRVNDEPWAIIATISEAGEPRWTAVPSRGRGPDEWLEGIYASFGFSETASRTSGWDSSVCGLLTQRVFASVDRFDEGPTHVMVRAAGDAASDLYAWMSSCELAEQLRQTWVIGSDEDDFIEWGFLQLLKTGGSRINVTGLDSSIDEYLGVGLTSSSEWTFTCSLTPEVLRAALGEMQDSRPGGVYVKPRRTFTGNYQEQLEQALSLPDEDLEEEGWVPAVQVDREMGIKIFNRLVEPEVATNAVDDNWPESWDARIAPLWLRLGGATAAAKAWADAGWSFKDVLRAPRLSRYWNPPMEERLRATDVRPIDSIDGPSEEESAWPEGNHTIKEFIEALGEDNGW